MTAIRWKAVLHTSQDTPSSSLAFARDLYLNTGHGTLGWTHACGSGKSIARIISGLRPEVDFAFVGLA